MPATRNTNTWPIARTASTDVWAAMLEKFCTVMNTGLRRLNIRMRSNRMMPGPSLMNRRAHRSNLSEFKIVRRGSSCHPLVATARTDWMPGSLGHHE